MLIADQEPLYVNLVMIVTFSNCGCSSQTCAQLACRSCSRLKLFDGLTTQ